MIISCLPLACGGGATSAVTESVHEPVAHEQVLSDEPPERVGLRSIINGLDVMRPPARWTPDAVFDEVVAGLRVHSIQWSCAVETDEPACMSSVRLVDASEIAAMIEPLVQGYGERVLNSDGDGGRHSVTMADGYVLLENDLVLRTEVAEAERIREHMRDFVSLVSSWDVFERVVTTSETELMAAGLLCTQDEVQFSLRLRTSATERDALVSHLRDEGFDEESPNEFDGGGNHIRIRAADTGFEIRIEGL